MNTELLIKDLKKASLIVFIVIIFIGIPWGILAANILPNTCTSSYYENECMFHQPLFFVSSFPILFWAVIVCLYFFITKGYERYFTNKTTKITGNEGGKINGS